MESKQILVVDDDPNIRNILFEALDFLGHGCRMAEDGLEALDLIRHEQFSAVICDIRMPGLSGMEVLRETRKISPDTPFIMITGFPHEYDQVIEAGAKDFIKKPFKISELKIKLNRLLGERSLENDNQMLLEKTTRLNDRLSSLLGMAKEFSMELDFDTLFPLVVKKVTEALGAERTSLYLIDWDKNEIWTKVAEDFFEIRLTIGKGISGKVAATGEIINVADAWKLSFFDRSFDLKSNFRTRSVLCVPVSNRSGERIAVIQVINKIGIDHFDDDDVQVLTALSGFVAVALENSFLVEELENAFEGAVRTLAATVDARHPLTAGHSQRVTSYAIEIARQMGLDEDSLKEIKYAGLLHDIGKIGIRDNVLLKRGRFSAEERAAMNEHPRKTLTILEKFYFSKRLRNVPMIAACHHEKMDGTGYPMGLKGEALPLASKILAVADVFDALTSRRDYPKYVGEDVLDFEPMPLEKVVTILKGDSGTHFDARVVDAFLSCMPGLLKRYRGTYFTADYVDKVIFETQTNKEVAPW